MFSCTKASNRFNLKYQIFGLEDSSIHKPLFCAGKKKKKKERWVSLSDLRNKVGLTTVSHCFHLLSLTTVSKWRVYLLAGNGWTRLHSQISSSFEKVRKLFYVNLPYSQSRTKWWCIVIWLQTVVLQVLTDCVSLAELL